MIGHYIVSARLGCTCMPVCLNLPATLKAPIATSWSLPSKSDKESIRKGPPNHRPLCLKLLSWLRRPRYAFVQPLHINLRLLGRLEILSPYWSKEIMNAQEHTVAAKSTGSDGTGYPTNLRPRIAIQSKGRTTYSPQLKLKVPVSTWNHYTKVSSITCHIE